MKYLWLLLLLLLVTQCAYAGASIPECDIRKGSALNNACINKEDDDKVPYDYGTYLHFILWESKDNNISVGNWNTWEVQRGEITSLIDATIYLNRETYQKDK